jgi:hypothetical protein
VEGDQENKTGQETFCTAQDISRNLGKKQRLNTEQRFVSHIPQKMNLKH